MFRSVETMFFQFYNYLNMLNPLDVFCNHLMLTASSSHVSIEGCQLTWAHFFTKKSISTLSNTLETKISWEWKQAIVLENAARVYPEYKQKYAELVSVWAS